MGGHVKKVEEPKPLPPVLNKTEGAKGCSYGRIFSYVAGILMLAAAVTALVLTILYANKAALLEGQYGLLAGACIISSMACFAVAAYLLTPTTLGSSEVKGLYVAY